MKTCMRRLCLVLLLAACRGDSADRRTSADSQIDSASAAARARPDTAAVAPLAGDTSARDTGAPSSDSDSARLVLRGQNLFQAKGCRRCHTVGQGYRDGPDLAGVTERRTLQQITLLLTETEEAIQTDPDFQQLRIEHFLDMPNLGLTRADALALYYYLRAESRRARQ